MRQERISENREASAATDHPHMHTREHHDLHDPSLHLVSTPAPSSGPPPPSLLLFPNNDLTTCVCVLASDGKRSPELLLHAIPGHLPPSHHLPSSVPRPSLTLHA